MVQQLNAKEVKGKILDFLNLHGPSLPVQVSRHMQMETLFISAFLSEMLGDKTIKITNMKVGGSPLYYTQNKSDMLAGFSKFLKDKEKEAFDKLKENQILEDSEQHPAIRVALRNIKDFAIPFKKESKIFWRYYLSNEEVKINPVSEIKQENFTPEPTTIQKEIEVAKSTERVSEDELDKIRLELEEKKKEIETMKVQIQQIEQKETKIPVKKIKKKQNEEFMEEIRVALGKKNIEILKVEQSDSKQLFAKVKINEKEHLLAAFNKKKIDELDILKAYKKASSLELPYYILTKGEPSKKTKETMNAFRSLTNIETLERQEQQSLKTT